MVPWWTQYQFQDFSLSYFFPYWVLPHVDMLFLIKRDHTFVFFPSTCFPFHGKEPKRATKSLNIQSIFNGATSDHLCLLVLKMRLVSSLTVRRKVIGPSATTTWSKIASGLRLCGRYAGRSGRPPGPRTGPPSRGTAASSSRRNLRAARYSFSGPR
jgi:hypothetical protein